jgi:hypothetical protein
MNYTNETGNTPVPAFVLYCGRMKVTVSFMPAAHTTFPWAPASDFSTANIEF